MVDAGFDEMWYWQSYYKDWKNHLEKEDEGDIDWPSNESTDSDFCFDMPDWEKHCENDQWCEQCGFCDHFTDDGHWDGPETTILPFYVA